MTTGTINNGRVVQAGFGDFAGPAGMVERAGGAQIAFFGSSRDRKIRPGAEGTIDGDAWRVLTFEPSAYVKGMVVLTVEPIEASHGDAA